MTEISIDASKEQEKLISTVGIVLLDGDKVLAVRNEIDSRQKYGSYNLPGGRIEEGETPKEAAIRELQEETGLITDEDHISEFPDNYFQNRIVLRDNEENMDWRVYVCTGFTGELRPEGLDGKKSKPEWMKISDLVLFSESLPNVAEAIHGAQQFIKSAK